MSNRCALIMAGGTGGHIFPGLAVAESLRERGWRVHWLGTPDSMESRIVPPRGFGFESIDFAGVRGKGLLTLVLLPMRLLKAFWQSLKVMRRVRPDVLVGLGGYVTFPGAMMGVLLGKPLVLHEQNSVAGMANKVLAGIADCIFTAFPDVLKKAQWVGNPLAHGAFTQRCPVASATVCRTQRTACGCWSLGGSLGAKALNEVVPTGVGLIAARTAAAGPAPEAAPGRSMRLRAGYAAGWGRSGTDTVHRQHRPGVCRCRPDRLSRGRQHGDRNRRRGCCGAVRSFPFCGR